MDWSIRNVGNIIKNIAGGQDFLPGVNNPFNSTTDGTKGTTGTWESNVQPVSQADLDNGLMYYDSQTGGLVGSNLPTAPQVDLGAQQRAAEAAAKAQADAQARNSFNQGRTNILSDIQNSAGNYLQTGRNSILDFVEGLRSQQQGVDTQRANAVLGKRNAASGIQSMVGQGIRSFGVNLANRNAGDSSAALAGAQAYGRMGNQQMQDVNQQYGLTNANLDMTQQGIDTSRESGLRKFDTEKDQTINSLTNYAQQQFATLNQAAEGAGIMDRIAIEQEKENIKNDLIQKLAALDARGQSASVRPMDQMGIQNKAQELSQLGQGGTQFDFTGTAPTQLQTGSPLGQLPIFSNRRRRD